MYVAWANVPLVVVTLKVTILPEARPCVKVALTHAPPPGFNGAELKEVLLVTCSPVDRFVAMSSAGVIVTVPTFLT